MKPTSKNENLLFKGRNDIIRKTQLKLFLPLNFPQLQAKRYLSTILNKNKNDYHKC